MGIHPTAIIDKRAKIGSENEIGPYVVIEGEVTIGNNNYIGPGTIITGNTTIGDNNQIHGHVYIGNLPQDVAFKNSRTYVIIGNNNIIREFATIHRGTKEESKTIIGNNNFLMVASHVAHNCILGNNIVMVNAASLGGYVEVHDHAFLGGFVIVHQFCRIGSYTMSGILTKVVKDVPPFMLVDGNPAKVRGTNVVGLKRKGFNNKRREVIKKAYKILYRSGYKLSHSLEILNNEVSRLTEEDPESAKDIEMLVGFIKNSKRGIVLKSEKE